jgi:outer membrane receptor protein involved in Fe transport
MGNLSTTYTSQLTGDRDWYGRADFMYHGDYYTENLNLATAPDYLLTTLRVGVLRDDLRVELFVRNLFDEKEWRSAVTRSDFSTLFLDFTSFRTILIHPQEKRTVGLCFSMSF